MNHEQLSKRLEWVANYIPKQARLADIGSDHAYLPCYLALHKAIDFAVAGEVVKGPFELAQKHVAQLNLSEYITVRLGDGLAVVEAEDKLDTVTICGMGGDLITSILERGRKLGKLEGITTLILQPNVDEDQVRKWLMNHLYQITNEAILEENGKIYEIIVAKPTKSVMEYSQEQLQFGVYLPETKSEAFIKKWQREYEKYDKILASLQHASEDTTEKVNQFKDKQKQIKEMIK